VGKVIPLSEGAQPIMPRAVSPKRLLPVSPSAAILPGTENTAAFRPQTAAPVAMPFLKYVSQNHRSVDTPVIPAYN